MEEFGYAQHDKLYSLIEKADLVDAYENNPDLVNTVLDTHFDNIEFSSEIFSRQAIVVIVTIIEATIEDFFKVIFFWFPERMYSFLNKDDNKLRGKVDLNEIIKSEDKTQLIDKLSSSAAEISTSGRFPTTVKNINLVTKGFIEGEILDEITSLVLLRNKIVHELDQIKLEGQKVEKAFSKAIAFVCELERVAVEMGIPIVSESSG